MSAAEAEAEDLISHLSRGLHPADRDPFRRAAEAALASSPQCWGPGSIYRALVPLWRDYFHPPAEVAGWDYGQRRSGKLIGAPALKDDRDPRCAHLGSSGESYWASRRVHRERLAEHCLGLLGSPTAGVLHSP